MKDRLLTLLKVAISLGLIAYLLFFKVDLKEVGRAFAGAHIGYFLLALALYFVAITLGCYKWQRLLRAQGLHLPLPNLLSFTFVGLFFGNFLLPMVAGDVVRGYDLARSTERVPEAAISVVVDKLIGLLAFATAGTVLIAFAVWGLGRRDLQGVAFIVILAFAGFVLLFASILSRRLRRLMERVFSLGPLQRLAPIYQQLSEAMQCYRDHLGSLAGAFAISLGVLLITNIVNWLLAMAVGAGVPLLYIFIFNPLVAFAPILIPSIGGLGVNQGAYDLLYATLGGTTSSELAITFSLMMQMVIYLSSLPGGVLWLMKRRPAAAAVGVETPAPTSVSRQQE